MHTSSPHLSRHHGEVNPADGPQNQTKGLVTEFYEKAPCAMTVDGDMKVLKVMYVLLWTNSFIVSREQVQSAVCVLLQCFDILLLSGCIDFTLKKTQYYRDLNCHGMCCKFSEDGKMFAVGLSSGDIKVCNLSFAVKRH